ERRANPRFASAYRAIRQRPQPPTERATARDARPARRRQARCIRALRNRRARLERSRRGARLSTPDGVQPVNSRADLRARRVRTEAAVNKEPKRMSEEPSALGASIAAVREQQPSDERLAALAARLDAAGASVDFRPAVKQSPAAEAP